MKKNVFGNLKLNKIYILRVHDFFPIKKLDNIHMWLIVKIWLKFLNRKKRNGTQIITLKDHFSLFKVFFFLNSHFFFSCDYLLHFKITFSYDQRKKIFETFTIWQTAEQINMDFETELFYSLIKSIFNIKKLHVTNHA